MIIKEKFLCLLLFNCFILFSLLGCAKAIELEAVVIDKKIIQGSGTSGFMITPSGRLSVYSPTKMGYPISSENYSYKYLIYITENGKVYSIYCDSKDYYNINRGDIVRYWKKLDFRKLDK